MPITIEEGITCHLDFNKIQRITNNGMSVIPVAVQDYSSKEVLMVAYTNEIALKQTLETGLATFWSTTNDSIHPKGETSGDKLKIRDVRVNCEQNSLLYIVELVGNGSCHTRIPKSNTHRLGCFYRRFDGNKLDHI